MKDSSIVILGVLGGGAALAGLVAWAHSRVASASPSSAPPAHADVPPAVEPAVMFPDLKVGDPVLVDPSKTTMPPPFSSMPVVACLVDMVLSDKAFISVRTGVPGVASSFSGTIPRAAILQALPSVPPGLSKV